MTPDEKQQWQNLLTVEWGRNLAWRMIEDAGVFHVEMSEDPMVLSRKAGGRNQMLRWMAEMQQSAPGSYATMLRENIHE